MDQQDSLNLISIQLCVNIREEAVEIEQRFEAAKKFSGKPKNKDEEEIR